MQAGTEPRRETLTGSGVTRGIAIGRNVWQHKNPPAIARSLAAIVHEDASALEALALLKEPVR